MGKQREASRRLLIGMWPFPASRARAGDYLRRAVLGLLAWVLLVAGVLKTHGLLADGDQLWGSSWLLAGAIMVECVVAAILVCDPRRRRAWLVGSGHCMKWGRGGKHA